MVKGMQTSAWFPLLSAGRFVVFDTPVDTSVIYIVLYIPCLGSFQLQDMFEDL